MNKKLILAFVLVPVIFVTAVLIFKNIKPKTQTNVLSANSYVETPQNPKLEIYDYNVYVQYPTTSEWIAAQDQQVLVPGTKIKTDKGGRAQLVYPNGTVTRLNNDTQIILQEYLPTPQKVTIFVEAGTIWSRITKLLGGESYETESKNLVATVRGTIYEHTVLPTGEDKVLVESHIVHVKCSNNQIELDVNENETSKTNCVSKPVATQIPVTEKQTKWFTFNKDEDKKLRNRFKNAKYDEEDDKDSTPTPTSTPATSTLGTSTALPTPTATPTSTATPRPTPTPTPTPTPLPLSVTGVSIVCVPRQSARYITSANVCSDGSTQIEVKGTGFASGIKVSAISTTGTEILADYSTGSQSPTWPDIKNSNDMIAHFSSALQGTYHVRIYLGTIVDEPNASFTIY